MVSADASYKSELSEAERSRCDEVDVGVVDEFRDDRQPEKGIACVNGDEVATFLDGTLRVTLQGIRDRRIAAVIHQIGWSCVPAPCPV